MRQCFSKTDDQCSQTMKQATKEAFDNNMNHYGIMKKNARTYLNN